MKIEIKNPRLGRGFRFGKGDNPVVDAVARDGAKGVAIENGSESLANVGKIDRLAVARFLFVAKAVSIRSMPLGASDEVSSLVGAGFAEVKRVAGLDSTVDDVGKRLIIKSGIVGDTGKVDDVSAVNGLPGELMDGADGGTVRGENLWVSVIGNIEKKKWGSAVAGVRKDGFADFSEAGDLAIG